MTEAYSFCCDHPFNGMRLNYGVSFFSQFGSTRIHLSSYGFKNNIEVLIDLDSDSSRVQKGSPTFEKSWPTFLFVFRLNFSRRVNQKCLGQPYKIRLVKG